MSIQAVVFDAYGTLFDVYSIGALAEQLYPGQGAAISLLWRDKQIDYTRLITMSDPHRAEGSRYYQSFWDITRNALLYTLERFKLDAKREDYAAALSGGQRKLLEMARALMSEPKLVMLDEPMAGVNPALTQSLLDHIKDLKKNGTTVLFVEHDMHMVRHISDWVIVMAEGKVVAEGPPAQVMKDPAVIDAYLGAHADTDLGTVAINVPGKAGN